MRNKGWAGLTAGFTAIAGLAFGVHAYTNRKADAPYIATHTPPHVQPETLHQTPQELSDEQLMDEVQRQTLRYFTEFAHPDTGMIRERTNNLDIYGQDVVTTGGTGFGVMALITGVERGWVDRNAALEQITKIVSFLECADSYHGIFPHFLNPETGQTIAFSPKDDGADIVETSFLIAGLLSAQQYFDGDTQAEQGLRSRIQTIWEAADWNFHTKNGREDVLYWHWSPNYEWDMNLPVQGWNESLIAYVLAASSPTHPIDPSVYHNGWAAHMGGNAPDGKSHDMDEGPLFFSHYSFMGLDPRGLSDRYGDYWQAGHDHVMANRQHAIDNPNGYEGYSADVWGLTASDSVEGYAAHSPEDDRGVITPTAAISSMPYAPEQSMAALRYFHDNMSDKLWDEYGFKDAFSIHHDWVADTYLAIDQGPIVVMLENYRSGLIWDLFMERDDIAHGLNRLGFQRKTPQSELTDALTPVNEILIRGGP